MPPNAQIVSANNRKEFDEVAKWHFRYAETSDTTKNVFSLLNQPIRTDPLRSLRRSYSAFEPEKTAPTTLAESNKTQIVPHPEGLVDLEESKHKRKAHCRRKHRRDCPKHLLGNIRKAERSVHEPAEEQDKDRGLSGWPEGETRYSSTPPPGGVACGNAAAAVRSRTASTRPSSTASTGAGGLVVPNVLGGCRLATFLSGVGNPHYTKANFERRVLREHPNFDNDRKALAVATRQMGTTFLPKDVTRPAPRTLTQEQLVSEPLDWQHHRTKYEMKSHMEAVRLMGTALLREFSGAAFK